MIIKMFRPICPKQRSFSRLMSTISGASTDLVITEEVNDKGIIILNRPEALNATNIEMHNKILQTIQKWDNEKSLILIKNIGKGFSAGGDLRTMVKHDDNYGKEVFRTMYPINYTIANLRTPYISFINGVTMGGGVGMSFHGKYSIATENTIWAMPELSIGLFPDCGASHFFPRLQGKLGYFLGMTGYRLKAEDVFHAGISTHYCDSSKLPEIEKKLLNLKDTKDVGNAINDLCPSPKNEFTLSKHLDQINKYFDAYSVEEILINLEKDNSQWAQQTINIIRSLCPTSVKVTFRNMKLGESLSLGECLQMEYRLASRIIASYNFKEGVRSVLITKSKNPKWEPSKIEDVSEEQILPLYKPLDDNDELPINVKLTKNVS